MVAREAGTISLWLVYSSNITVYEVLALSEGEINIKTSRPSSQHNCGLSDNQGTTNWPPAANEIQLKSS